VHMLPTHLYERAFVKVRYLRRYIRVFVDNSVPGRYRVGAQENGLSSFQSGLWSAHLDVPQKRALMWGEEL
jgi:hypothetical protein